MELNRTNENIQHSTVVKFFYFRARLTQQIENEIFMPTIS